jgi:hypothetical protein
MQWGIRGARQRRYSRRRDEVVAFFLSQLRADPVAMENWNATTSRTRELYCDYIASNWSRKMRFLRALDTVEWCHRGILEKQVQKKAYFPVSGGGV